MRRICLLSVLCLAALAPLAPAAGAAPHKHSTPQFKCPKGFKKVKKTVTRHGLKKVVFHCMRNPASVKTNPVTPGPKLPVPSTPSPASPAPVPTPPVKQASTTTLGVDYQDLPPERLGLTEFKIGQYTLTGAVAPFAVPDLSCNGLAGCVEPAGSLQSGSLTVPLLARLEYEKKVAKWKVGVTPSQGTPSWLTPAEAASGSHFFQATGAPDPNTYLPSSAQAPIQITPHLPGGLHRVTEVNRMAEGMFELLTIIGSYAKLGGSGYDLVVESNETASATSSSGCKFQVRISGIAPTGGSEWSSGYNETVFANRPSGSLQVEVFVRHEGGGMANCGLDDEDTYVISERPHT